MSRGDGPLEELPKFADGSVPEQLAPERARPEQLLYVDRILRITCTVTPASSVIWLAGEIDATNCRAMLSILTQAPPHRRAAHPRPRRRHLRRHLRHQGADRLHRRSHAPCPQHTTADGQADEPAEPSPLRLTRVMTHRPRGAGGRTSPPTSEHA
ncbi:hypothetical protein [Nonomuraea dietziae]|uniref:hypothetical protein n=1 Tax=Nonomuraea dietziae TaxID=65515 RepID=UPI0031D273E0